MARVTVEDCVKIVPNRFDLILTAAGRAKALDSGAALAIDRDRDKNTIVALREIEEGAIDLNQTREGIVESMQRYAARENPIKTMETKEIETEAAGDQLYSDAEFVESDSFQVVDDLNA